MIQLTRELDNSAAYLRLVKKIADGEVVSGKEIETDRGTIRLDFDIHGILLGIEFVPATILSPETLQRSMLYDFDRRYDQYVAPLEADHLNEYALVLPDGTLFVGKDTHEVFVAAKAAGHVSTEESFLYQIGPRASGRM